MKPYYDQRGLAIYHGSCLEALASIPDGSVHCCVTSPPYWGLRSYLPDGHPDKASEIGLEESPEAYVSKMVAVFREVRRVLREDGTLWINLGDSYSATQTNNGGYSDKSTLAGFSRPDTKGRQANETGERRKIKSGLKPKDLVGIPWRVALALQADGWWLRSEIIWHKPNPMPESVTDRPTKSHEQIFLLAKAERYFYDAEAVKEESSYIVPQDRKESGSYSNGSGRNDGGLHRSGGFVTGATRNLRSVWTVATQPYSGAHFAVFPPALITPCILAGTSARGCCPACGAPWVREVEKVKNRPQSELRGKYAVPGASIKIGGGTSTIGHSNWHDDRHDAQSRTIGWSPSCACRGDPIPCTVLDPFFGTGTTAFVALEHGRHAIGIELNEEFIRLAIKRNVQTVLPL